MVKKILDWLEERVQYRELIETHLTGYMVPANLSVWYSMGAVLLTVLGIQFATGILLLAYYIPHTSLAFESVMNITGKISFGWLIRRTHAIAANLFILVLMLHMLSTLIMGSYKKPREIQWISGVVLFGLGLMACLSGYLLPWSQLSYWATTVATNSAGSVPVIGDDIVRWIRGGDRVDQMTLGRFYALHVSVLPPLFAMIVAAHLFFMRRAGISAPPGIPKDQVKKVPFFPHFALEDLRVVYFFLALLFFGVFFTPQISFPPDAMEPADPLFTPPHIKPEWYFLANYQMLKIIPNEFLGVAAQGLAGLAILLLPFIDRNPERRPLKRPLFLAAVFAGLASFVGLTVWGHLS
ncbi:MAG: cytochrome bc complex cytochrome b subunit [Nitrospirae bacterium]|nr:cytochrome bc complex cytochrome b subunit [Nitrospirota bacterium]